MLAELVGSLWWKLWRRKEKHHPTNTKAPASNYSYPRRQSHPLQAQFPRRQEGWHPQEAKHRTKERQYWRRSIGLTLIAVGGALASAWLAKGALKAGRDQAAAAVEGNFENNRAWVKVLGFDNFVFSIGDGRVDFGGTLLVKNVGHSPAERIEVLANLVPDFDQNDPIDVAISLCRPSRNGAYLTFQPSVFPDDPGGVLVDSLIAMKIVLQERASEIYRDANLAIPMIGKDAANRRLKQRLAYTPYAGFNLVGCVNYFIPAGKTYGHTTFVYELNRPCAEGPVGVCAFDLTHIADYRTADVLLKKALGGSLAN